MIEQIIELAVDPSNGPNQMYLMAILLELCKECAPEPQGVVAASPLRDLEDTQSPEATAKKFDPESAKSKQMLTILRLTKETQFIYNLLVLINTVDMGPNAKYTNQYNRHIYKFGQARLRSLEILNKILSFLHPSYGALASAQIAANPELEVEQPAHPDLAMDKYISKTIRRQLVRTCLVVMREYSFCCIASQFCILIFDQIKTLFDVTDVVELQKFVI